MATVSSSSSQPSVVCRCCQVAFPSLADHKVHHRSDWHAYNLRRYLHELPPVSLNEFNRKRELLLLAASQLNPTKKKPSLSSSSPSPVPTAKSLQTALLASISSHQSSSPNVSTSTSILSSSSASHQGTVDAALTPSHPPPETRSPIQDREGEASRDNKGEQVFPSSSSSSQRHLFDRFVASHVWKLECISFFDTSQQALFSSCEECVGSMYQKYGFLLPDEEYLVDLPRLMRIVWKAQIRSPRCLFCEKRFKSIHAAMQHMQEKGHTQLKWAEYDVSSQNALQRKLIDACYDYRSSYARYLQRGAQGDLSHEEEEGERKKKKKETQIKKEEKKKKEEEEKKEEDEDEKENDDWEDMSSGGSTMSSMDEEEEEDEEDNEEEEKEERERKQRRSRVSSQRSSSPSYKEIRKLQREGERLHAHLTETGDLRLPDGRELVNRHVSYIYKQRLGYRTRVNVAEAHLLADLLYTHHVSSSSSSSPGTGSTALACTSRKSPGENSVMCRERSSIPRERDLLAALMSSSSSSRHSRQAFLKRQDRRLRFLLTSLGRCNGEKDRPSSLSHDYIHRKLACRRRALKQINRPRKSYLRQVQQQHMKLGVRQNKLHKFILQQNKYFF